MSEIQGQLSNQCKANKQITDGNYDLSLAVKCINGTFVGKKTENVIAYKGIPFVGKQPVGELRWKTPADCVPDDGVYEAYYFGKSPCMHEDFTGIEATLDNQGEDCLYLNLWKADDASAGKKPVMVWIHGGAFETGASGFSLFDCHNFVKENPDVIVVTVSYRLALFGFLHLSHLPDGKDYPDAQNLGLLDQIKGLKWIHDNIASFGGDPDNVTIWGESAGAGSVTMLPLIKGSQAYFKRVIAQSGSPTLSRSKEQAIACTNELLEILGCKTVADLQKVDAKKVAEASGALRLRIVPERDGLHLPLDPYEAYANGAAKDIAFLQGCNKSEFDWFVAVFGKDDFKAWAEDRLAKNLAPLTKEEKILVDSFCNDVKGESYKPYSLLMEQIWFNVPVLTMSENQTKGGGKSYTYFLTRTQHGIELPVVFNHPEMNDEPFDETFSKTMRRLWVQFAKTGNPSLSADASPDGKPKEWPLYDSENKQVMVLDESDIHPEKESGLKIVDWERTYFLTKYYCF